MTLRDLGWSVVRAVPGLEGIARRVYARLPEALHDTPTRRIAAFFAADHRVSFVQVGVFDGIAGDPIRSLVVREAGWRGVLVEPQPAAFEDLRRNYAAQAERLTFLDAAVAERSGERPFYTVARDDPRNAGLPDWASELASFDPDHIARHCPAARVAVRPVRTVTFSEAAGHLPDGLVDLVVIDVEGYERRLIESIPLDRHRVRFLMYEHKHLSRLDVDAVDAKLSGAGFTAKRFGRDTVAWRTLSRS